MSEAAMGQAMQVVILAFDGMEALDFAGPFEVFTTADRVGAASAPNAAEGRFTVSCVARRAGAVRARAGLTVLVDADFAAIRQADVLVVPGGVVDDAQRCSETLRWISAIHATTTVTASVCTGAFLLAAAGVVTSGAVTTHWEDLAALQSSFPGLEVVEGVRWVDRGHIATSAGISAGIDMSLHLVARLGGNALARRTAHQMDYRWNPSPTNPD